MYLPAEVDQLRKAGHSDSRMLEMNVETNVTVTLSISIIVSLSSGEEPLCHGKL
jgi:hypothetical protein